MDSNAADQKKIAADPFAADIFAPRPAESDFKAKPAESAENTVDPASLWFERLPRISRREAGWNELLMKVAPEFYGEMSRRLAKCLAGFLASASSSNIEFLPLVKREIHGWQDFIFENSLWLIVGIENSGKEIAFEIDEAFAVWLADAVIDSVNYEAAPVRELTASETAILEFLSLNLAHEANQTLDAPIFRFRSLSKNIPLWLRRNIESDNPALLAFNWQTIHGILPSVVKMYLTPQALQALQAGENRLLNHRASLMNLQHKIRDISARLQIGGVELSYGELAALETDDIILLQNHEFTFYQGNLSGRAEIFPGAGESVKITGDIANAGFEAFETVEDFAADEDNKIPVQRLNSNGVLQIRITGFEYPQNSATENIMAEDNETPGGETAAEKEDEYSAGGGGLAVENLAVNLRVELDTRRFSLAEIANLRENQTLSLGVRPTDPVNLLVDNQIIGRGELVAVDDRLGVRITKLLR